MRASSATPKRACRGVAGRGGGRAARMIRQARSARWQTVPLRTFGESASIPLSRPAELLLDGGNAPRKKAAITLGRPSLPMSPKPAPGLPQKRGVRSRRPPQRPESEEDAIRTANDTIFGLAAGIWKSDVANAMRVAGRIEAGTVISTITSSRGQSPGRPRSPVTAGKKVGRGAVSSCRPNRLAVDQPRPAVAF
ncbi:MAG: hypothetical protein CM15mP60_1370 [Alphaproteobacteria bacterium]|nr:MAG: hypothetical protein CM15mP60_1370 [Alphaproteobacteria bacterium]